MCLLSIGNKRENVNSRGIHFKFHIICAFTNIILTFFKIEAAKRTTYLHIFLRLKLVAKI